MKSLSMKLTDEQIERMVDNYLRCKGRALPVTEEQIARFEKKLDKETPQENLLMNAEALLKRGYVSHEALIDRYYPQQEHKTTHLKINRNNQFAVMPDYENELGLAARNGVSVSSDSMEKMLRHLEKLRKKREGK